MEHEVVQPDLRIFQRGQNVTPCKTLMLSGIAVVLQTMIHSGSLGFIEELCFGRPIGDIPESCHRENAGQDAFDDEDPTL